MIQQIAGLLTHWEQSLIEIGFLDPQAPKKLMITTPESGVGFNRPWHENHDIVLRWYDHWLRGIDTGIMDEPSIKYWVMEENKWRYGDDWPLPETKWTKYYLHSWERMRIDPFTPSARDAYDEPDAFAPPGLAVTV